MYFKQFSFVDWTINLTGSQPSSKYLKWIGVFDEHPRIFLIKFLSTFSNSFIWFSVSPYQASHLKIKLLTKQLFLNIVANVNTSGGRS